MPREEKMGDEWGQLHGAKMEVIQLLPGVSLLNEAQSS